MTLDSDYNLVVSDEEVKEAVFSEGGLSRFVDLIMCTIYYRDFGALICRDYIERINEQHSHDKPITLGEIRDIVGDHPFKVDKYKIKEESQCQQ